MKLPKNTPSLKQFMLQKKVIGLYRDLFRSTKLVEDQGLKKDLQEWIKQEFKSRKNVKDEDSIKNFIYEGEKFLKEVKKIVSLTK